MVNIVNLHTLGLPITINKIIIFTLFIIVSIFVLCFKTSALLSSVQLLDDSALISAIPADSESIYGLISQGSESKSRIYPAISMLSSLETSADIISPLEYAYVDISSELDFSLFAEITSSELVLENYTFPSYMSEHSKHLNTTLAGIYGRYLNLCSNIPLKDPLWLIALGSVEYNYTNNPSDIIFSFPIDTTLAEDNQDYLVQYNWKEVERIGGKSLVLRRDGSSIGILQITSGFGTNLLPVIPEEFGTFGSVDGQRSDCWVELGDGSDSGSNIVWKPGIEGDRWSPADNANIVYAVYDYSLKGDPVIKSMSKYEQAILLMWAHNRGTGIISNSYYIEKSRELATYVPELIEFVESVKPVRFTRDSVLKSKYSNLSSRVTNGDDYPVMALLSYLITEARYSGKY